MPEPIYIAQTAEPMTGEERFQWFQARARDAQAKGCRLIRCTVDDAENPTMALIEGWEQASVPDQGEPRWQMTTER